MDCCPNCPDPGDKEAWRQYTKCTAIAAVIVCVVIVAIILLLKL